MQHLPPFLLLEPCWPNYLPVPPLTLPRALASFPSPSSTRPSDPPPPPPSPPSPSYGNLALFFQSMGESELALRLFRRTLQLMALASGAPLQHPGASTLFINIALTYQVRPSCCSGIH